MANEETVISLTWKSKATNFKSAKGNVGTLITFNEKQSGGEYDGKNIIFWSSNPQYREASKEGWQLDTENNRVLEPSNSEEELVEMQAKFAAKHEAPMQYA